MKEGWHKTNPYDTILIKIRIYVIQPCLEPMMQQQRFNGTNPARDYKKL